MNYRKRALVLGCSFTAGSYKWDPSFIVYKNAIQPDGTVKRIDSGLGRERLDSNGTWVKWLNTNDHYTVFAIPGSGMVQWSSICDYLDRTGQFNFDYVLVARTFEPRLVFSLQHEDFLNSYTLEANKYQENKNITMWQGKGDDITRNVNLINGVVNGANLSGNFKHPQYSDWVNKMFKSKTTRTVLESASAFIDDLCVRKNIPLFEFSFSDQQEAPKGEFEHSVDLGIPTVWGTKNTSMKLLFKKKYHVYGPIDPAVSKDGSDIFVGHFTLAGNKFIGTTVRRALDKHI